MKCLICNEDFKSIRFHIKRKHKINSDIYRKRFSLPQNAPLEEIPTISKNIIVSYKHESDSELITSLKKRNNDIKGEEV